MKGYIWVTLNEDEFVLIPVQNIEYIGYNKDFKKVEIYLSVGSRRGFAVKESLDEIKARLTEATK